MLEETQKKEAEKLSEKYPVVRILFDFYLESEIDGEHQMAMALNKMLLDTSNDLSGKKLNQVDNEELSRIKVISDIFKTLKTVTNGAKKEEPVKKGFEGKAIY